jgi:polar amino acid transport system substrate-binding protein
MTKMRLLTALGLLIGVFALSACGSDDDSSSDSGDSGGSAAAGEFEDLISDGTLTVGSDIPYPPFEMGDPPDYEGFDIDLINAVGEELGLEVEIVDVPFFAITSGGGTSFDLAIAATTTTEEREQAVDFSDPYFIAQQSMLTAADSGIDSIEDVTSETIIGVQDGTTGDTYAQENTEGDVRPFDEVDDAYGALERGQVDVIFNDLPSTQSVADDSGGDLVVAETYDTGEEYGIVFREDEHTDLREAVNEALVTLKEDGTLDELYQEYFGVDMPQPLVDATHEPS